MKQKTHTKKQDVYQQVTDRICDLLEQGTAPWQSPHFARVGFPRNFSSGKRYRGINVFLLGSMGYASPFFLTFLQAKELGGHVRKGEKGSLVLKYGTYAKETDAIKENGDPVTEERRYLKAYTVFHASQIEGIEFPEPEILILTNRDQTIKAAEKIVAGMPNPPAIEEGRAACPSYLPKADLVEMPAREYFERLEGFYKSLFHELSHATGHASRLARETLLKNAGIGSVGDDRKVYSKEELVAEMGAAFLAAEAGIVLDDHQNTAAYLNSWLTVLKLKENRRWIVEAAGQAQKAADYILDRLE